eukprot:scaffold15661_cov71-Phaeocystis_antarctica.AAC.1
MHRTCDHMTRLHADARAQNEAIAKLPCKTNARACPLALPLFARSSQGRNSGDRPLGSGGRRHISPPPRLERALTAGQAAATVPVVMDQREAEEHILDHLRCGTDTITAGFSTTVDLAVE